MAETTAESAVGKYLGALIGGALTALVTWATAGSTGAIGPALVSVCLSCALLLVLRYAAWRSTAEVLPCWPRSS